MRGSVYAFAGALGMAAVGCAVGAQLVAPHDEYRLYRATRLAPTMEQRLAAANRYLHAAPNGVYARSIKAWFYPTERAYVARAHDQLPLLNAYVAAMPDGPSAPSVRSRIEELETAARFEKERVTERKDRVRALEANLARAAEQRRAFTEALSAWVAALASVRSFGQPLGALAPELLTRLGVSDPSAGCPLDVCVRTLTPRFAIPARGASLVPREAEYVIEVKESAGALAGLRLYGRELFSRVGEALDLQPVSFADPQARAEAIGSALSLIQNALGPSLSADGCERPAVSPVVLTRACDGVQVTVTAAIDPGDDDVIAFGPEEAAAPVRTHPANPGAKGKP